MTINLPIFKCVICEEEFYGYGNNAEPLATGRCCDMCDMEVIAYRIKLIQDRQT